MIDQKKAAYWLGVVLIAAAVTAFILAVSALSNATTTQKPSIFGTVSYDQNPYIYEAVNNIAEVTEVDGNLNLRVNPVGAYMLYDEIVLLCGMPVEKFSGVNEPFLMTYERRSHKMVHGVGCHTLLRVDGIVLKDPK